jgi:hypothetical protein
VKQRATNAEKAKSTVVFDVIEDLGQLFSHPFLSLSTRGVVRIQQVSQRVEEREGEERRRGDKKRKRGEARGSTTFGLSP